MSLLRRAALTFAASAALPAVACGACGCSLHTDWASQGLVTGGGLRLSLRFDYFDQDRLRAGRNEVDRGAFSFPTDQEIQQRTITRAATLGLDYSPDGSWGLTLLAPTLLRTHETLAAGDTEISASRSSGLGDVRLLARYQGFREDQRFGLQFGVKLPTGRTRDTFSAGPQAGSDLDRGLQPGTGTTDLLVGAFAFGDLSAQWGAFAQAMLQVAAGSHDGFRPGNGFNLNLGLRYDGFRDLTPQIQLNTRVERRDSGPSSDAPNSGATTVHFSPGMTFHAGGGLQLSAFVQVPVYQRVNGLQIEPRSLVSVTLAYAF